MKTTTVSGLKADVFDAIRQGVILDRADTLCFEAFDAAIDAYVNSCSTSLSPTVVPAARTRRAWLTEVTRLIHRSAVMAPVQAH